MAVDATQVPFHSSRELWENAKVEDVKLEVEMWAEVAVGPGLPGR